eukprot:8534285-Alexandrium_andersonii.AAC.1
MRSFLEAEGAERPPPCALAAPGPSAAPATPTAPDGGEGLRPRRLRLLRQPEGWAGAAPDGHGHGS